VSRVSRWAPFAALLAAGAPLACSIFLEDPHPLGPTLDAALPLAPVDAGPDSRPDSSPEAAAPDAAPWTGEVPLPGEWLPMAGLPATCAVRMAKDARVSASRLPWAPCANGRAGCEVFLADWGVVSQQRFMPARVEPVFEDAAGVHITYRRAFGPQVPYTQVVTQLLDGDAEASWYSGPNCSILANRSRHGFGVSVVDVVAPGTPQKTIQQFLGWSTSTEPLRLELAQASLTSSLNLSQGVARGADFLTLESTNFGGPIVANAFRLGDRRFARSTAGNDLDSYTPIPTTGGYVAHVAGAPSTAAFMPLEGGYRVLARPAAGYKVDGIQLDRANGDALVWSEAELADDSQRILWTSPFASSESGVARRAVARFSWAFTYIANAGAVVAVPTLDTARIIRLSDGMGWEVRAEPGLHFLQPLWINDDSVWLIVWKPEPATPDIRIFSGAIRIRRSTLGLPTVPSGL